MWGHKLSLMGLLTLVAAGGCFIGARDAADDEKWDKNGITPQSLGMQWENL